MGIETYAIILKPESPFGTPLKGDTIFGHFCWQVAEDPVLLDGGLSKWIPLYDRRPFAVFSSAWPYFIEENKIVYAIKRPDLPNILLEKTLGSLNGRTTYKDQLLNRKKDKAKRWFLISEDLNAKLDWNNFIDDEKLYSKISQAISDEKSQSLKDSHEISKISLAVEYTHNTINRITMTTGKKRFAPYNTENLWYVPWIELVLFVAFYNEACSIEQIVEGIIRIGKQGFGRDSSVGLGRFSVSKTKRVKWPKIHRTLITLGPCVPDSDRYNQYFFNPFIRFGRHGASLACSRNPFKTPIVMADEGAVFMIKEDVEIDRPFIGRAIKNISKVQDTAVAQGYSLVLPLRM